MRCVPSFRVPVPAVTGVCRTSYARRTRKRSASGEPPLQTREAHSLTWSMWHATSMLSLAAAAAVPAPVRRTLVHSCRPPLPLLRLAQALPLRSSASAPPLPLLGGCVSVRMPCAPATSSAARTQKVPSASTRMVAAANLTARCA